MKTRKEAPELLDKVTGANEINSYKDTSISIKNRILSELSSGQKFTAKQLNDKFLFNDSRKILSVLRSEGKVIKDIRQSDRTKLYFLIPDSQLSLFEEEGNYE